MTQEQSKTDTYDVDEGRKYEINGRTYWVHDQDGRLYREVGRTNNPRAMLPYDRLLYDGEFVEATEDNRLISVYHNRSGRVETFTPTECLEETAIKLKEVNST